MRVVTPTDMRKRLGEILDAASAGERIWIERDHKPLAVLVSIEDAERIDAEARDASIARRLAALDALVEFGKELRRKYPPAEGEMTAAEWIRWDRDHRDERHLPRAAEGGQSYGAAADEPEHKASEP